MFRQLLRTGVSAAGSTSAALASHASLASSSASNVWASTVVSIPSLSFAKYRPTAKKKKIKTREAVNMHKLRQEHEKKFIAEDEDYVEPSPSALGNALISACTILERVPVVVPKIPEWELVWLEREDRMQELRSIDLPMSMKKSVYGKNAYFPALPKLDILPNYTEDDAKNDRKSIYRKIDRPLYLIVKTKQTADPALPAEVWHFPSGEWRQGETLRKTAERGLFYSMGDLQSYYLGNAPICALERDAAAGHKKDYPQVEKIKVRFFLPTSLRCHIYSTQRELMLYRLFSSFLSFIVIVFAVCINLCHVLSRIFLRTHRIFARLVPLASSPSASPAQSFYHHALYLGGKVDLEEGSEFLDYAWVAKEELAEYFTSPLSAPLVQLAESVLYYDIDSDPEDFPRPLPPSAADQEAAADAAASKKGGKAKKA